MPDLFTLEAVFARKGDALILHYGPQDDPRWILVDGGPRGVYRKYLKPRLDQLRQEYGFTDDEPLPLKMVMVSHIDDDHIAGILDLVQETVAAQEQRRPPPYQIGTLWHNSFEELLGGSPSEIVSRMAATAASHDPQGLPLPPMSRESQAVVASTAQGRELRDAAKKLRVPVNKPFPGLVVAPAAKKITLGNGLSFTVIGPSQERVAEYQKQWDKDLEKIRAKEQQSAQAAAFADDSPFNLASICVLARRAGKSMLLTGDARGDFVIEGLERARLLRADKPLHVDVLKVPHHGSDQNVEDVFFQRITAEHYVISGDGEQGNPEPGTLEMIQRARGSDEYTIHFTFTADAHLHETSQMRRAALQKVQRWLAQKPSNCQVLFRPNEQTFSIAVDLLGSTRTA